jgi:hypothetical protein
MLRTYAHMGGEVKGEKQINMRNITHCNTGYSMWKRNSFGDVSCECGTNSQRGRTSDAVCCSSDAVYTACVYFTCHVFSRCLSSYDVATASRAMVAGCGIHLSLSFSTLPCCHLATVNVLLVLKT